MLYRKLYNFVGKTKNLFIFVLNKKNMYVDNVLLNILLNCWRNCQLLLYSELFIINFILNVNKYLIYWENKRKEKFQQNLNVFQL